MDAGSLRITLIDAHSLKNIDKMAESHALYRYITLSNCNLSNSYNLTQTLIKEESYINRFDNS